MTRVQVRRWPLPLYNPRWLLIDPVRIDALIGIVSGIAFAQFLATTTWKTLLIVFLVCVGVQLVRAMYHLHKFLEELRATKFGRLKICGLGLAIGGLLIAMLFFPLLALGVAILFLGLRIGVLMIRDDRVLLLTAAAVWLASPLPSLFAFGFCWGSSACNYAEQFIPPVVGGFLGLFVALTCNKNGYRVARFPLAMVESTTLVFGIVLAGFSVLRTAVVAMSSPGVGNIQDSAHASAGGRPIGSAIVSPDTPGTRTIWVTGHMRTLPDGSTANNIAGGIPGRVNPEQIHISAYRRSLPDGILSNNLSARPSQIQSGYLLNEGTFQGPFSTLDPSISPSARSVSFVSGLASLVMSLDMALRDDVSRRECRNKLTRVFWVWIPVAKALSQ
jgi:hypothetical protein